MLFGQRRFQLRADGLNAFYPVKVIKIRTVVVGEVGKQKLSICESGCILPLPESGFVIVATNDDCLVRQFVLSRSWPLSRDLFAEKAT